MARVPLIDISPFRNGSAADKRSVARAVDEACREVGFLVITGHSVSEELLDGMTQKMDTFFRQPLAQKQLCGVTPDNFRGYRGPNATALAKSRGVETPPDLMERFTVGRFDFPRDAYHLARIEKFFRENRWPSTVDGFEDTAKTYFREMERLSAEMMRIFAVALDLPEDYFHGYFDKHVSLQVTNYYPAQREAPKPGQLRAGAHTDYGSLTLLYPAMSPGGLQVQNADGSWEDVPIVPRSFIINIGDLMAQWTNDQWVSTMHRVVNPEGAAAGEARMSIVYFQQPNDDALISCLPTCVDEAHPEKYAPVEAGHHVSMKLNKAWVAKPGQAAAP